MEMNWSRWSQCQSSFELLLVPNQPGIFALAEEVVQPAGAGSRRMLAVFAVEEADDLSRAMSRLFATGSQWREKMTESRCYVRYAVVANAADRKASATALKNWLNSQRETAAQIFEKRSVVSSFEAPGEMQSEHPTAGAEHEDEAHCAEALELKTIAERAVDRVTHGMRLGKPVPAGF
jgi:hypothetical protein